MNAKTAGAVRLGIINGLEGRGPNSFRLFPRSRRLRGVYLRAWLRTYHELSHKKLREEWADRAAR